MNVLPTIRGQLFVVAALAMVFTGCEQAEQIQTYTVKKEVAPPAATVAEAPSTGEPTDRMLAAVLPDGDRAWFFKVVGPIAAVEKQTEAITDFFSNLRPAPGKPHPDWKLPAEWSEQVGSGMCIATITIPADGKPLELSVTSLPWTGSKAELLSNVNRWRGQMQLAPTDDAGLADTTHELKAGDSTLTVVDLQGRMQSGGMTPPFAGAPQMSSPRPGEVAAATGPSNPALPPNHPPLTTSHTPAPAAATPFEFKAPESWQSIPATGMRKLAFNIGANGKEAQFTAIDFPASAGPMMADPVANVNRWRGEVGLPSITADDLKTVTRTVPVEGPSGKVDAILVTAIPDAAQPKADRATLAAMVNTGEQIWFFKLTGDRETVAAERGNFESFLKSVRFAAEGGAGHGN